MKLYYTDERENKQLITENDDIIKLCDAADIDARHKFILLKRLSLKRFAPRNYVFVNKNGEETGYSIEE